MGLFKVPTAAGLTISLLLCWGCTTILTSEHTVSQNWSCDVQADAAVRGGDWSLALELHHTLLEKDPSNCLARYHMGYIQGRMGDRELEIGAYEQAVACGYRSNEQLFFNLGMAYHELGRHEHAANAFESAIDLNPRNAENYYGWALAAQSLAQTKQAMRALTKALEIEPHHYAARLQLASSLLDAGRLQESRPHLEILHQQDPNDEDLHILWQRYEDRRSTRY